MRKTTLFLLIFLCACTLTVAQTTKGFHYQALLSDNTEQTVKNESINIRASLTCDVSNEPSYVELHNTSTNNLGVFSITIGKGTLISGSWESIDWAGNVYLQIEIDREQNGAHLQISVGENNSLSKYFC